MKKQKSDKQKNKENRELKKPNNLVMSANQLKEKLADLEKQFAEDEKRFLQVTIKDRPTSIDMAGRWAVVERQLKRARFDEEEIAELRKLNIYYVGLFLDIEKLKIATRKEEKGIVYRRQPVLREKGDWIIQQAGEFASIKQIHTELVKRMGYNITLPTIRSFVTEHKAEIDKLRDDFRTELLNSSITVDSGRLKFWEEAYAYYYEKWKVSNKMVDFNACAKIINEVRAEVKGDIVVKIDGKIDINHTVEANKSLNQKLGELNINLIVVGLAAQKVNMNPLTLFTQLASSYYDEWNGISREAKSLKEKNSLVPVSGFIKNYNWDEIRAKNEKPVDPGTFEDAIVIDSEEEAKIIDERKQKLLEALKQNSSK